MKPTWKSLRINGPRMRENFDSLSQIGSTDDGGVHRPALGKAHLTARAWFRDLIITDGFDFQMDGAGNYSARIPAPDSGAQTLILGSHLDSVPYGGRFDGALGVMGAYEVLQTVRDAEIQLPIHLEAIDFTDEEGTLVGLLGSRALTGALKASDLIDPRGGRRLLLDGLERAGLSEAGIFQAKREAASLAGFLEMHIEQGPKLLDADADIGIVRSLVGIGSIRLTFIGRADHAGTTPMDTRLDAGLGAADFILATRWLVMEEFPGCVANVGRVAFEPGALNIVPAKSLLTVEYRSPRENQLERLKSRILEQAHDSAGKFGLAIQDEYLGHIPTTPCSPVVQVAFERAVTRLGLKSIKMDSGAGHDTMALAAVCPAGLIFIPSTGGSHAPTESAEWEDCIHGANVLLQTALDFAMESSASFGT